MTVVATGVPHFRHRHAPIEIAVHVCAWCSAVAVGPFWVKRPRWLPFNFDVRHGPFRAFASHGVCDPCKADVIARDRAARRRP